MNMTETESRFETQKLLKTAVQNVKQFELSPEISERLDWRTRKSRQRTLRILNGQIEKFTNGRLLCQYTSQTGKSSKNIHYHWLYLDCDSQYSLSHFEKKEFSISELLTFTKSPFPYSINHSILIKRHCLERLMERNAGNCLENFLQNISGPLDVLIRHYDSLVHNGDNTGYVLITTKGYWIVKLERNGSLNFKLTTILPRNLWSGRQLSVLSEIVENLNKLDRPKYDSEILEPIAIVALDTFNVSQQRTIQSTEAVYKFGVARSGNVIRKTSKCHLVTKAH